MTQPQPTPAGVDEAIGQMERLYRAVTGSDVPSSEEAYAPIPAEKDPAQHVEEQLNRLMRALDQMSAGPEAVPAWVPAVAVWEGDNEVLVCVDLPGVKREQVEVVCQGNAITVSGTRTVREGARLRASERPFGRFHRTLVVPAGLRVAELDARMRDGVLEIRVPRPAHDAPSEPQTIAVH